MIEMALPAKSIKTYTDLIDTVIKKQDNLRFDTLDSFAKEHNLSYDWIKERAEVLSYASHAGDFRKIPKTLRQDVRNVREELRKGTLSLKDVQDASNILLRKTPLVDIERLNRQFLMHDEKVLGTQGKIAERVEKTMKMMTDSGVHPVRAYNLAWSRIGRTLHHEIPKAVSAAPRDKVGNVIERIWTLGYQKAQANHHYTDAGLRYSRLLEGHLKKPKSLPTTLQYFMRERGIKDSKLYEQRLESDYKNVKRFPRPGAERPFPRDVKSLAKDRYLEQKWLNLPKPKNEFDQELAEIGKKLRAGDVIWRSAKELEEKEISPFVRISRAKRRRFRA